MLGFELLGHNIAPPTFKTHKVAKTAVRGTKSRCAQGGLGYSFSLKLKWGYISAQNLESER